MMSPTTKRGRLPLLRLGNWVFTCDGCHGRINSRQVLTRPSGTRSVQYGVRVGRYTPYRYEQEVRLAIHSVRNWGELERAEVAGL